MILVTLGTHGQPMLRLVPVLTSLATTRPDLGPFEAQLGPTPAPGGWVTHTLVSSKELDRLLARSDIVITHGGPATIAQARAHGRVPIVIPRRQEAGEHVDDHQVYYSKRLAAAGEIIMVEDAESLPDIVGRYGAIVARLPDARPHDPRAAVSAIAAIADSYLSRPVSGARRHRPGRIGANGERGPDQ